MLKETHILEAEEGNLMLWLPSHQYGEIARLTYRTHLMSDLGDKGIFALEACLNAVPARWPSFLTLLG